MTLEPVPEIRQGGLVKAVASGSFAELLGVLPHDVLLAVNEQPVNDVIDVQYYAADEEVNLTLLRGNKELTLEGVRAYNQQLGLEFEHPTFDVDIRRCNNLCEFCFVLQMAPRMRRTLYIKDDDYRYSFLFGHFVTLTNLTDHDWWRIANQSLSPLYVSVHATDLELRRQFLRNDEAPDIMQQLSWLIDNGIEVHTQIVVTPEVNDGSHLEESVRALATLYPGVQSVSVVPVGLTKHHKYEMRVHTVGEAETILESCHKWQEEYKVQFDAHFVYPTDEWYLVTRRPIPPRERYDGLSLEENGLGMVRRFVEEWQASQSEVEGHAIFRDEKSILVKSLTLVTGTLFGETLESHASAFAGAAGVSTEVVPVENTRLGETITVAGLLMGQDVIDQIGQRQLGEVVVLPRVMFDHPEGVSLDDVSPLDIAQALGKPVALADLMGDVVDIAHGQAALLFDPQAGPLVSPGALQRVGGWAVEKYL